MAKLVRQTYKCEGCGKELVATPEEAFDQGWDTPERFMSHCTCSECPINTTLWWQIVMEKKDMADLTKEEVLLIAGYNALFDAYQKAQGEEVAKG